MRRAPLWGTQVGAGAPGQGGPLAVLYLGRVNV